MTKVFKVVKVILSPLSSGKTHQKYLCRIVLNSQKIDLLASHRSHKFHRERIVTLALAIRRVYTRQCGQARAKRRAFREICEICVKLNHLCEDILALLPWSSHLFLLQSYNTKTPKSIPLPS